MDNSCWLFWMIHALWENQGHGVRLRVGAGPWPLAVAAADVHVPRTLHVPLGTQTCICLRDSEIGDGGTGLGCLPQLPELTHILGPWPLPPSSSPCRSL